jgi:hypothetical protein
MLYSGRSQQLVDHNALLHGDRNTVQSTRVAAVACTVSDHCCSRIGVLCRSHVLNDFELDAHKARQ